MSIWSQKGSTLQCPGEFQNLRKVLGSRAVFVGVLASSSAYAGFVHLVAINKSLGHCRTGDTKDGLYRRP